MEEFSISHPSWNNRSNVVVWKIINRIDLADKKKFQTAKEASEKHANKLRLSLFFMQVTWWNETPKNEKGS